MATVSTEIEIATAPADADAAWGRFVEWVRVGPGRLLCDELSCIDAARSGVVTFAPSSDGRTRATFALDADPAGPPADLLEDRLRHDLVMFKDYVERGV